MLILEVPVTWVEVRLCTPFSVNLVVRFNNVIIVMTIILSILLNTRTTIYYFVDE